MNAIVYSMKRKQDNNKEVRTVTEGISRTTEQELQEVHEDITVIAAKKPEMMPILVGVIKGMRLSSEASETHATA